MVDSEHDGPLAIGCVAVPGGGWLGIAPCPGRNHLDAAGHRWQRRLERDLARIAQWGARAVVSLVETDELAALGVPELGAATRSLGLDWYHLPIPDMHPPGAAFDIAWARHGSAVLDHLRAGERVLVHCAGGLGRSGTLVAKLLVAFGSAPDDAIREVRRARPGAIETAAQADYVASGPGLGAPARG